jgi:hypothetical protein
MNKMKGVEKRLAVGLIILMVFCVSGPAWAENAGATQGSVALNLASSLGLSLPAGATGQDAISALSARGINPGWSAGAAANGNFCGGLYTNLLAAFNAGSISLTGGMSTPACMVAAACAEANIPQSEVVNAIKDAGGDGDEATRCATFGGSYDGTGGADSFGPGFDGSRPGSGGGGGGVNPSPNS